MALPEQSENSGEGPFHPKSCLGLELVALADSPRDRVTGDSLKRERRDSPPSYHATSVCPFQRVATEDQVGTSRWE